MIASGTRFGSFEIFEPLGAGGMGEVYRAKDLRLAREVAVKVLPQDFLEGEEGKRRFEREAQLLAALNHPNIATIHSFEEMGGRHILVMELLDGETLRQRLGAGPLPTRTALDISRQIAEGLAAAHQKNIVHRDLKPENVMITSDGRAKILDFGLAKELAAEASTPAPESPTRTRHTDPGTVLGTVGYMSPEQVRGLPADARSDVFSFGAILYEMLTGRRAFRKETAAETMTAILHEQPAKAASSRANVPPAAEEILRQCLEKDPARRVSSAGALAARLREVQDAAASGASRSRRRKAIDSVAVLPFVNAGGDHDHDYLSEGITERLIDTLSRLPKLRVMARSTVFRFAGREIDPLAAGRELDVRAVLTGRLTKAGDVLRAQAELVDVTTGFRLWGARYDRPMRDLLAIEEEISKEICDHLRFKLSAPERRKVAKQHTRNAEAYQLYLKGRFFWNKWTPEGMHSAIRLYESAIEMDPSYALAWGGIADAFGVLGNIKAVPPAEAFPRAKSAALRALELDPNLAEAHASLGFIRRFFDWEWSSAEREFQSAVRLSPGYATGHRWYGQLLSGLGRHEEAIVQARRALELDPLSVIIHTAVGDVLFYARLFAEAIELYRKALELDPDFVAGHSDLARALEHSGRTDEAIRAYEKAVALAGNAVADPSVGLANAFAVAGRRKEALDVLEDLKRRRDTRYVSPWGLASIYARLGETGFALEWLERAYDEHDSTLVWLKVHPRFDALRAEPRFLEILRKMGLS